VDDLWAQEQAATGTQRNKIRKSRESYLYGIVERLRPEHWLYEGYDKPATEPAKTIRGSLFDPRLLVLGISGKHLSLPATLRLTEALRGALMAGVPQPLPEWLSGHASSGGRSEKPHLALMPLPFIGREHADGRLMGVALTLPRAISQDEAVRVLGPWLRHENGLPRRHRLFDGQWFECSVELDTHESPTGSLRQETWTGPTRVWASVTPVVLDRHFDGQDKWEHAADSVKDACERLSLPRPQQVFLHPVSMFEGVPRSTDFPDLIRKKDGGRMHHAHALIVFEEDVEGPVLVGAGRYRGYGLCRPLRQGDRERA
jgi:CRISPR-associated protein Csb2